MINTLLDLLPRIYRLGDREAFRYYNGYRSWCVSYRDLFERMGACAQYFKSQRIDKRDRIILWGENRPEWVAAFWAAVASGIQVVPADFNSSSTFVNRLNRETHPKLIIHGEEVEPSLVHGPKLSYQEIQDLGKAELKPVAIDADDIVEIVYTSGTTSEPKGVIHRHRNICANLRPFAEQFRRYRLLAAPFQPIRLLDLLPLSHMFGQSMGVFIPPLLGGGLCIHRGSQPALHYGSYSQGARFGPCCCTSHRGATSTLRAPNIWST